jgi:hypothetical protein
MMTAIDNSNTLVIAERNEKEDGIKSKRVKLVIWFETENWYTIPNEVIAHYKSFGFYLVVIPWYRMISVRTNRRKDKSAYSQIINDMHFNSIESLIRLIKFYRKVLSQFDVEKKSPFNCMTYYFY